MPNERTTSQVENPYRVRRHALRKTQQEIADACGISRLSVLRNEQGLFERPLPAITSCRVFDFSGLEKKYAKWVRDTRRANVVTDLILEPSDVAVSPIELRLRSWFGTRSRQKFSTQLLVHPVSLVGYCDGRQAKMPKQLEEALRDIGYGKAAIEWIKLEQYEWGEYIRGAGV